MTAKYQIVNLLVSFILPCVKSITQSVNGADIVHSAGIADLSAQVLYVLVDKIKIRQVIGIIPPEMGGNGLTGKDPVLIDEEIQQQVEFFPGGVQGRIADTGFKSIRIQADLVE